MERLLEIVVPAFADVATLDAVSGREKIERLGARVRGPRRTELELALLGEQRSANRSAGVARAIATGESQLVARWGDETMRSVAAGTENLDLLRALELRSVIYLPLRARGQIVGALVCGVGSSGRTYDEEDLRFAEVLAGRIALALDNAGLSAAVSGLEQRLAATLANLAEAIIVRDADDELVFANPAAVNLLGLQSLEALSAADRSDLMALYDAFDEQGRRLALEDLPATQAKLGEHPAPLLVRNVVHSTGQERWLLHKATPVFDSGGALSMVVNVIEEVTDVKRAELAQRLLAEAGRELSASLDYEQTLQKVAQLAVPELADWCGVSVRGHGDMLDPVAVAHADPAKVALAREFGERYPARLSDPTGAAEVIRTGEPQLAEEITEELLTAAALSPEQLELVRELEMRSVIIVPLAAAGRPPIGAMTLVMAESGRRFDRADLELAEELGRRAATAVENARLYTERSRIATTLQQSLLPPELPQIPGIRLASLYRAAGRAERRGGRLLRRVRGSRRLDGPRRRRRREGAPRPPRSRRSRATRCARPASCWRIPVAALVQLNEALRERPRLSLVTACCALLRDVDGRAQADVVLAGHPPAYHVRAGEPRAVGVSAPFLGIYEDGWEVAPVALAPGDLLVLYTDGVIDTVGATERFGEERLADTLRGASSAEDAVRRIERAVSEFADGPQVDDTAVLAVERAGP